MTRRPFRKRITVAAVHYQDANLYLIGERYSALLFLTPNLALPLEVLAGGQLYELFMDMKRPLGGRLCY